MPSCPISSITLSNGSIIQPGYTIAKKEPFQDIPVVVNELHPGNNAGSRPAFRGQTGYIEFDTTVRLPRHVHIAVEGNDIRSGKLLYERICVIGGVALVELGGEMYVIPPQSSVTIAPGVPHTWTACPAGVEVVQDMNGGKVLSNGKFLMVFEYEDITSFYPTAQTNTLETVDDYVCCDDLQSIRFPVLSAKEVKERCWFIHEGKVRRDGNST
jgi:hypothetical protein